MAKKTKVNYRKPHKLDYEGKPKGDFKTSLFYGDFGLQVVRGKKAKKKEVGSWVTRQQVKASQLVIKRMIKSNKKALYWSRFSRF
jgi:ribosomal protein L16/L10AE